MNYQDLKLLLRYVASYRVKLISITVLTLMCALFEAVSLGILVPLIDIIGNNKHPTGNLWNILTSLFGLMHIELNFTSLLASVVILFLLGQTLIYLKQVMQINLRFRFVWDLKNELIKKILETDLSYHHAKKSGELINTALIETERVGGALFALTELFSNIVLISIYLIMLLYISFQTTIICILVSALVLLYVNRLLQKSKVYGEYVVRSNTEINEFTTERLSLLKLIKIYSTEVIEEKRFNGISDRFRKINAKFCINGAKIELLFQSIMFVMAVVIILLSLNVFNLSFAMLLVFLFILIRLTAPLRSFNNLRHELSGQFASLSKVDQILSSAITSRTIKNGPSRFTDIDRGISLQNVSFSYSSDKPVLHDISLEISKNEMIAFVGASGGGKSTLVDLVIRLIDPDSGKILIDGTDLKEFEISSYHQKLGVVSQDTFIFNDSVLNNICYGGSEVSPKKAEDAARIAYAHDFIMSLPEGYETQLGDRGVKLSGGEKQRIALARALYKNPDILILDEATSALDSESEKIIQNSIGAIKHKYTIIVVAHRLSTIENADKIVVIEDGKIQEAGSHRELLERTGSYAKYHAMQHSSMTNGN